MIIHVGDAEYDEYIRACTRNQAVPSNTFSQEERTVVNVSNSQSEASCPTTLSRRLCVILLLLFAIGVLLVGGFFLLHWVLEQRAPVVPIVGRKEWGARPPRATLLLPHPPATHLLISNTYSPPCDTQNKCIAETRHYQHIHMDGFTSADIWYNFLVGGDGKIYEGRGWDVQPMASDIVRSCSISVSFIGSFSTKAPPENQLAAAYDLIELSVKRGKLADSYTLISPQQLAPDRSPGPALFRLIQTWPHWKNCSMEGCSCSALESRKQVLKNFF